jgi:hypothetical protein
VEKRNKKKQVELILMQETTSMLAHMEAEKKKKKEIERSQSCIKGKYSSGQMYILPYYVTDYN